jgi:hypothetical protein
VIRAPSAKKNLFFEPDLTPMNSGIVAVIAARPRSISPCLLKLMAFAIPPAECGSLAAAPENGGANQEARDVKIVDDGVSFGGKHLGNWLRDGLRNCVNYRHDLSLRTFATDEHSRQPIT